MSNTKNLADLAAALDDGTSDQLLKSTGSGGVDFTSTKTVGGESILGSGDISTGETMPWNARNSSGTGSNTNASTFISGSNNTGRYFTAKLTVNGFNVSNCTVNINGSNSWAQLTGGGGTATVNLSSTHLTNGTNYTLGTFNSGNQARIYLRGYLGAGGNMQKNSGRNVAASFTYWNE